MNEFEQNGIEAEKEHTAHSEALAKEIADIRDVEGLLARAEELVVHANPLDPKYTDDSNAFIVEARKRLETMDNGGEKDILQKRLDAVYSEYSQKGTL